MTTALASKPPAVALAVRLEMEPAKLDFIRQKIASGTVNGQLVVAPDDELEYFIRFCQAKGLDPTAREVYFIARKSYNGIAWTIQTGIDGFRAIAERTGELDGIDEPEFRYDQGGKLVSATVRVYRKGASRPFVATAFYQEYVQTDRDGAPNSMWRKMQHSQLSKCAEALALRKAFPRQLGGTYTADEMGQANNPEAQRATAAPRASRAAVVREKLVAKAETALASGSQANDDAIDADASEIAEPPKGPTRKELTLAIRNAWAASDALSALKAVVLRDYAVEDSRYLTDAQRAELLEHSPDLIAEWREQAAV